MKRLIYTILLLIISNTIFSQNVNENITGTVVDGGTQETLPFANAVLYSLPDTTFVTGTVTDSVGHFSINATKGSYILKVSMVGYKTSTLTVASNKLDTIQLTPTAETLKEITVIGNAKIFRMENGGISADIQNTPLKNMGNLSDVLGQMPFVLKNDNNFTVLGKGTPLIYINNRQVRDNNELGRINSKDIKKITIVTNPGAEYDASVNAVIKIETTHPEGDGLGGEIYTYDMYNSKPYTRDGVSLDYRAGGLDIFGSFDYGDMNFPKRRTITNNIGSDVSAITKTNENDQLEFLTPQIGFDYVINDNNSFGARYQFYRTTPNSISTSPQSTDVFLNNQIDQELSTQSDIWTTGYSHYVNAYYNGKLSSLFNVKLDMDYKSSNDGNHSKIDNIYKQGGDTLVNSNNSSHSSLYAARLNVETPLWKGTLAYGLEGSHTLNTQQFDVIENTGVPGIEPSDNRVTQNLWAAFVSYSKTFGQFSANAGLRYEDVSSKYYEDDVLVDEQSKRYKRLFPSASISYNGKAVQISIGYRNSVSRPSYNDLKSSIYYVSPYVYTGGNPLLTPTYTNSLTYMVKWKDLMLMASYDWNKDYMAGFMPQLYMGKYMLLHPINIDDTQHLSVSLNYSTTWFGIWRPNWDLSVSKNYIRFGEPAITFNTPILYANFRNNFNVNGWQFGLKMGLSSKGYEGISYEDKVSWSTNVYVNKNFFKDKLQVNLSGNDLFNTGNYIDVFRNNGLSSRYDGLYYRRAVVLEIHYRFNVKQNSRYKGSQSTNEMNRF